MTGKIIKGIAGFYYVYVKKPKKQKKLPQAALSTSAKQKAPSENKR